MREREREREPRAPQPQQPPSPVTQLTCGGAVFLKDNFKAQRGSRPMREKQGQSCQPTRAARERNRNLLTAVIRLQFCSLRATLGRCGLPPCFTWLSSRPVLSYVNIFRARTKLRLWSQNARDSGQSELVVFTDILK